MKLAKSMLKRILPVTTSSVVRKYFVPNKMDNNDMQNFINLSLFCRAQGDQKRAEKIIDKILVGRFEDTPGLPKDFIEKIMIAFESMRKVSKTRYEERETFIEQARNIESKCLTCHGWLNLYRLLFRNGLVREAYFIRNKAVERGYNEVKEKPTNVPSLFRAFNIATDNADFQTAYDFLEKLRKTHHDATEIEESEAYYYLTSGNIQHAQAMWRKKMTRQDELFLTYIEGKSVAIVGPAASVDDVGEEIDSFEVVVRTNYRGREYMPDPRKYGKVINISYYNGMDSRYIENAQEYSFLNDLDYALFKKYQFDFQKRMIKSNKGREIYLIGAHFWSGHPVIVPLILYDIFHFRPSKVKLFNLNMHLSKNEYNEIYRGNVDHNDLDERLRAFASHDILSSFNFCKNLYESGVIETDRACSAVLNMSAENYMSGLEEIYAPN